MAKKKKLSAADAAYFKNLEQLEGRAPLHDGALPGQIDMLTGEIAGSTERVPVGAFVPETPKVHEHVAWPRIPVHCPGCDKIMSIESGWTPLKPREDRKIQCGVCGHIIIVPQGPYDTLALALRARFGGADLAPVKVDKSGKKTRGAG
jgi:ribosomal protein S27E